MQYGFLGMNRFEQEMEETQPVWLSNFLTYLTEGRLLSYNYLDNNYLYCKYVGDMKMEDVNLCIAMHITHCASAYLCYLCHLFLCAGSHVTYTDTDSIQCTKMNEEKYPEECKEVRKYMGKKLGQLKDEWRGTAEEIWSKKQKKILEKRWEVMDEKEREEIINVIRIGADVQSQISKDINYLCILESIKKEGENEFMYDPVDKNKLSYHALSLWHKSWMELHPTPIQQNSTFSAGVYCGPKCYGMMGYLSDDEKTKVEIVHFKGFKKSEGHLPLLALPEDKQISKYRRNDRELSFELLVWLSEKTMNPLLDNHFYNVWTPPPMIQFRCHKRSDKEKSHIMEYKEAVVSFTCTYRKCHPPTTGSQFLKPFKLSELQEREDKPRKHKLTKPEIQTNKKRKTVH